MENRKVTVTNKMLEKFVINFEKEMKITKKSLKDFDIFPQKFLPEAFSINSLNMNAVYSHNRQQVLITFNKSNFRYYKTGWTADSPFRIFDEDNIWKHRYTIGVKAENVVANMKITGHVEFEVSLESEEIYMDGLILRDPYYGSIKWEYIMVFSVNVFLDKLSNVREFVNDFVKIYWENHNANSNTDKETINLEEIKSTMEKLFFDELTPELVIDDFIKKNPVILEYALNLINPIHQSLLKNIHGSNPKDYKPDLIAFDQMNKVWSIVDYKRSKRNILRNPDKARTFFKSEVQELIAQLGDYKDYFDDELQRGYFEQTYGYKIFHPKTIGVIGRITGEQERDFNKLKQKLPTGFEIIPYNYIYEQYCRFIEFRKKVLNTK